MNFKVSNPSHIKKLIATNPDDIKTIIVDVQNTDLFLDGLLDELNEKSDWPLAVNPALIVDMNNPEECQIRARNVIEMIVERDLYGLNVLDFGCGDGMVAGEMLSRGAAKVVAYDIKPHSYWKDLQNDGVILTTVAQDVASNGPYDFILLYDVLDHVMNVDPVVILQDLHKLLSPDGIITIRNHPWIARHGSHLYTHLNRAFAHVIFEEAMLNKRGYPITPTRKIVHPMFTYKKWFEKANLKIVKEDKIMEPVEEYFTKNEMFVSVINKHFADSHMEEYRNGRGDLARVLSFHFVDFILKK